MQTFIKQAVDVDCGTLKGEISGEIMLRMTMDVNSLRAGNRWMEENINNGYFGFIRLSIA